MPDGFNDMLHTWQNFYFMVGGTAATLIGLMFVALSLGMGIISTEITEEMKAFVTPSVFYFVSVLLIACAMLVPLYSPLALALMLFVGGLVGLNWSIPFVRKLIRIAKKHQDFNLSDWLNQVILPVMNYALLLAVALLFAIDQWSLAFMVLWATSILLLVCAIGNTWSLVVWIVEQKKS